ncbi:MAG TPA: hypothetical protein PK297_13730, partial [Spirochaetota bacterium]|nr:hypothetical protein [Spirochaetota bacterium]
YDLLCLRDQSIIPFARTPETAPPDWDGGPALGRFSFSRSGIALANQRIRQDIADSCRPLAIDEIGRLELCGEGLAPVLPLLKRSDAILVVRECFLTEIIQRMDITTPDCRIVTSLSRTPATFSGCGASGTNDIQRSCS